MYQYDLKVFPKFILSTNETECIKYSMQCSGLGGLVPNTLVLNMPVNADDEQIHTFVDNIKLVSALGKSVIIFKDL